MTAEHTELDTRNQNLRDMLTIRVVDFLERLEEPIGEPAGSVLKSEVESRDAIDANQFRDEVLSALIECQDYDRLYNRLMDLIERTATNAND